MKIYIYRDKTTKAIKEVRASFSYLDRIDIIKNGPDATDRLTRDIFVLPLELFKKETGKHNLTKELGKIPTVEVIER